MLCTPPPAPPYFKILVRTLNGYVYDVAGGGDGAASGACSVTPLSAVYVSLYTVH